MSKKTNKQPDYWHDEKVAKNFVQKRIEAMKENPDRTEIIERAEESEKEVYRFLETKSGSGSWEFETFIAHAAVMHMLAEREATRFEVRPREETDIDYSELQKAMLLFGHSQSGFSMNDFMCNFAAHIHGIAFAYDGWRTEYRTRKYVKPEVNEQGESSGKMEITEKNELIYDDPICRIIPLKFAFWDELADDIYDPAGMSGARDFAFVMPNQSITSLRQGYATSPFHKNLDKIKSGDVLEGIKNKEAKDKEDVTSIIMYFNAELDLLIEATPGDDGLNIIRQTPLPFDHKQLPFTAYVNEKIIKADGEKIGGYPIALKILNNERAIRKAGTMFVGQLQKSLDSPTFYKADLDFDEEDVKQADWFAEMQAKKKDGTTRTQSPFVPISTPADNIADSFYELRSSEPPASTIEFMNLARDQITTDSMVNTSIFNPTEESATLTGVKRESFSKLVSLTSMHTDKALGRRLYLQMKNLEQFYTVPKVERIVGMDEMAETQYKKIRLDNKIVEEKKSETDESQTRYIVRDADDGDDVKYSFVEVKGELFNVEYDIVVEPTQLSPSETLRRQNVLELLKILTNILSVAPQNLEGIDLTTIIRNEATKLGFAPDEMFNGLRENNPRPNEEGMPDGSEGAIEQGNAGGMGDNVSAMPPQSADAQMAGLTKSVASGNFIGNQV